MKEDPDQSSPEAVVRNWQRRHRVDVRQLESFLGDVARAVDRPSAALTVVLVSDSRMRKMNREFRGFDKPTDVLSFPAEPAPPIPIGATDEAGSYLGDIAISVETAMRQASRRKSMLSRELRVLALHGFLHLLGYDHEKDDGAMRKIEYRLRRRFRITTPRELSA